MKKIREIIIDTDPGIDDAVALGFALFDPNIDVKLITTVAGNVSLKYVTDNTLKLLNFWNKNIKVAKGAKIPLIEKFVDASSIHGKTGLDGYDFPSIKNKKQLLSEETAIIEMKKVIDASKNGITIMALGPLTNIALLFKVFPDTVKKIDELIIMGGSLTRGNKTPMAEFNIATDPEAAKIVFRQDIKIILLPLGVGDKALLMPKIINKLASYNRTSKMFYQLLLKYGSGNLKEGLRIYDSHVIAYFQKPEIYDIEKVFLDVEVNEGLTKGATVIDITKILAKKPNVNVCVNVDKKKFEEWFISSLKRCN